MSSTIFARLSLVALGSFLLLGTGCPPTDPVKDDTGIGATDADGDGFVSGDDCDDGNPDIYPGADEACDGIDGTDQRG